MDTAVVEAWLERLYIAAEGAGLRDEDRRKAREVAAMLGEIERAAGRIARTRPFVLVDVAAGKGYMGLLAAKLVLEPLGRTARVITLERDADRVAATRIAVRRLDTAVPVECRAANATDAAAWPWEPVIVVALHACGGAADEIIQRTIACRAQVLLLVPCCTGRDVPAVAWAARKARDLPIPRHAPVRRRFIQALVDAERTWRLEAAGYETEVVEFVGATVTPHNLLWRSRLVGEPNRMAAAQAALVGSRCHGRGVAP